MDVRRLIISDLHLGSDEALLAAGPVLERLEPELAWADELVINGDLLELVFASLQDAVDAARPFLAMAGRHVERVRYVVGNHDHHFASLAHDDRRLREVLCNGADAPPGGVAAATWVLRTLCPDVDVVTAYPSCELDGMLFTHGHYIAAHAGSADHWLMDAVAWRLTGAARPKRLTADDYEALITPLYELMYEVANLPAGRRAQRRAERWLDGAVAIAHAPRQASRRLASRSRRARRDDVARLIAAQSVSTAHVVAAMQAVCEDLDIRSRTIVFGHTHVALDGVATPNGRHRLFNSGAWVLDRRRGAGRRRPGTVLRATGGELELRGLLDDCDEHDLARMVGARGALHAA